MSPYILAVNYFFHLIATIVWIGGLALFAVLVFPEAQRVLKDSPAFYDLLARLRRRFLPLTNFSLAVLIGTGMIQMAGDPNYDGMLQFTNEWSRVILYKHIAIIGMLICGVILQYRVAPALERARLLASRGKADAAEMERLQRAEVRLTWVNVILGVAVLGFTAWATAL